VSLAVNNIQLKTALKLLLRPLGLVYKVEDEVLLITSPVASSAQMFPKTYYVGDLILPVNRAQQTPVATAINALGTAGSETNSPIGQAMANNGQLPGGQIAEPAIRRGLNWLLAFQNDDGGWAAFDRTKDRWILEHVPFADHNAMQDPSCPDISGRVLECFGHCGQLRSDEKLHHT
jgi:hypothetical protein